MEVEEVTTGVFLQVVHPDSRRVALAATYPIDRPLVAEELVRTLRSLSNGSVALLASYVSAVASQACEESNGHVTMHTSYESVNVYTTLKHYTFIHSFPITVKRRRGDVRKGRGGEYNNILLQ